MIIFYKAIDDPENVVKSLWNVKTYTATVFETMQTHQA
jgi:hypothetical protein